MSRARCGVRGQVSWPTPPGSRYILEQVRAVLIDGAEPDARTASLIGLLSASGSLPNLHRTVPWSGKVYHRAKELERASWGAEAVNSAVLRTVAAIAAGSAAAVSS